MKLKYSIACIILFMFASCDKDRYPEVENAANAQFIRALGVVTATPATNTSFNAATMSKATPTATDAFKLNIVEAGTVATVKIMVDYKKAATPNLTTATAQYKEITSWPVNYTVSLNDITALFTAPALTSATVVAGDKFVFRTVFTLKSGTIVAEQATLLNALPYTTSLTYTVAN